MKRYTRAAAFVLSVLLPGTLAARTAAEPPQSPAGPAGSPVTIEFRALASDGSPVADLKVEDVTLLVDGRQREIRSFDVLQTRAPSGGARPGTVPAPFATNVLAAGRRDSLLVIDDDSIAAGDEAHIKNAISQYLDGLGAGDRVGVLTVRGNGIDIGMTDQYHAIRTAAANIIGRRRNAESPEDAACRTRRVLDVLSGIAENYPPTGLPVSVLFFSTSLTSPGTGTSLSQVGTGRGGGSGGVVCEVQPRDFQQLRTVVQASALDVHVIALALSLQPGVDDLAGVTGNRLVQPLKGGDPGIPGLLRQNTSRYRVSFEPDAGERNGSRHRVEVQVKRGGVAATVRPALLLPKAGGPPARKASSVREMLREATSYRDIELRAAAFASRETGSEKVKIVVLFEPVDPAVALNAAAIGLYDEKGKLVVQGPADAANLARKPAMIAVLIQPGTYRLRVAATDAAGKAGTVDSNLAVALTPAESMKLSSLVLGVADGGSFAGRLTFSAEPMAVAYLEVYGVGKTAQVSAQVDVAATEDGPALVQGATKIIGDGADDRRVILGGVPIGQFPPGDVLVRMVVSLDGKPVGRVARTLRKADR